MRCAPTKVWSDSWKFEIWRKKSPAESRELVKWLFAGEIRVILSSAKSFSFRITRTLSLVWLFLFWLDWCLRWVKEFWILIFFLVCVSASCFLPVSLCSSDFYIKNKHAVYYRHCNFKTDQNCGQSPLLFECLKLLNQIHLAAYKSLRHSVYALIYSKTGHLTPLWLSSVH